MNRTAIPKRPVKSVLTTKNSGQTWIHNVHARNPDLLRVMTPTEERRLFQKIDKAVRRVLHAGSRIKIKWNKTRKNTAAILQAMNENERHLVNEAVLRNTRLVLTMARKFQHYSFALDDLVAYGLEGLLIAVLRFDLSRGYKFSTYAVFWIRHAIQRSIYDLAGVVRVPVHAIEAGSRLRKETNNLSQKLGREPTDEELAKASGLSLRKVRQLAQTSMHMFSLNMTGEQLGGSHHQNGERFELQDTFANTETLEIHPFDGVETTMDMERVRRIMQEKLTPKERTVLELRFFEGLTLKQVARDKRTEPYFRNHFPVSRERARQVQAAALRKIRAKLRPADRSLVFQDD